MAVLDLLTASFYNIFPFVVVLSILVFVHEMGHYLVARYYGVKVEVFSIGFGPEVFGWNDRKGTRWKVSYIPLGGYVRFFSDLNESSHPDFKQLETLSDEERNQTLFYKPVGQRIAISAAGPAANYLFAIIMLTMLYIFVGQRVATDEAQIMRVVPLGAAEKGGLLAKDTLVSIDGKAVKSPSDVQMLIRLLAGKDVTVHVVREGNPVDLHVTIGEKISRGERIGTLGVELGSKTVLQKVPFYLAPWHACKETAQVSWDSLKTFGQMIAGTRSADGLSGPIGIALFAGAAAERDVMELLWLSVFLSISLGLINLFPVPMLDGGHILFYIIEAVRGKPLPEKAQEIGFRIGFGLVAGLILFSTWNDLSRLKIVQEALSFFG